MTTSRASARCATRWDRAGGVRVDVNGAWDAATAARHLQALAAFDLEYAEQPCATWDEMAALRQLTRRAAGSRRAACASLRTRWPPRDACARLPTWWS